MIDRRSARRRQNGETGNILPMFALGFIAMTAFMVMTVDVGLGYMARGQLQNIADSASRAVLKFRTESARTPGQAAADGADLARRMTAANGIPGAQVIYGDYDFQTRTFRPGGTELNPAVRVVASRMSNGGNAIPGLLQDMDVMAASTATMKCRLFALVEDVSASFGPGLPEFPGAPPGGNELEEAKEGLLRLVDTLAVQSLPGDRVALVSFNNDDQTLLGLTPLPQALSISEMNWPSAASPITAPWKCA